MRQLLTGFVFLASLVAAVFVHAARADAAWTEQTLREGGHSPKVRLGPAGEFIVYARGREGDPRGLRVLQEGRPLTTLRVPRPGRATAFDVSASGTVFALREDRRRGRLLSLVGGRWRRIDNRRGTPVDARLAVARSGAAAAAWLQYEGTGLYVYAATLRDDARDFVPAERISGPVRRGRPVSLAVDDAGDAVVAYTQQRDLYMWRPGSGALKIHDATGVTAAASTTTAAVGHGTAAVGFTRLEDREPPRYRAVLVKQVGEQPPVAQTAATDVSPLDLASEVDEEGQPTLVTSPIRSPHRIDLHRAGTLTSIAVRKAPSALVIDGGAVAWTELTAGFAWVAGEKYAPRGSAMVHDTDVAGYGGRLTMAFSRGGRRPIRIARFTP